MYKKNGGSICEARMPCMLLQKMSCTVSSVYYPLAGRIGGSISGVGEKHGMPSRTEDVCDASDK